MSDQEVYFLVANSEKNACAGFCFKNIVHW